MQLRTTNAKDVAAPRLVCTFDSGDGYDGSNTPARHVSMVCLAAGISPSYALIPMPLRGWGPGAWDEVAPTVALQRDGPAGALKLRTKCRIYAEYNTGSNIYRVPVMNGWVVSHSHQGGEDSVITQVFDAKWILSKFTVKGRLCWDPSTDRVYWDLTSPKTYNAMGYPDCLDHPYLGPVFAPCHRFGYRNDFDGGNPAADATLEDFSEPEPGSARSRARSWRCQDALLDLYNTHAPSNGGSRPPFPVDMGNAAVPDDIVWVKGVGSVIGADRPLKAFRIEGESLRDAIQAILRKAGAYDLYFEARADGKSILTVLDMNPKSFTGIVLKTPETAVDVGAAVNSANIVKNYKVDESFINGFDEVVIAGDGPCREGMCSTTAYSAPKGTEVPLADSAPGALLLEPAWSDDDEDAFKRYIGRYGNTVEAFENACKRWPLVYCAYRIRLGADIWSGTKWAGMQQGGYSRIQPFQLTGYQQNASNPRYWCPREIIVEYLDYFDDNYDSSWTTRPTKPANTDPTGPADRWHEAARFDNLTLSADGTMLLLPGLRSPAVFPVGSYTYVSQQTHDPADVAVAHPDNGVYFGQQMRKRQIRIQLAVIANFPLTALAGRGGAKADDPNRIYDRVQKNTRFTWLVTSPEGDYVEYLRHEDSRPIGEANCNEVGDGGGQAAFPPKASEGNELFTDRVNNTLGREPNHAVARLKDVKRVEISATIEIEQLAPGHVPGASVTLDGTATIPVYGVLKAVVLRSDPQSSEEGQTSLIIEPPDSAAIYDPPSGSRSSYGNTGYSSPGTKKKEKTESYDSGGGSRPTEQPYESPKTSTPPYSKPTRAPEPYNMESGAAPATSDNGSEANNQAIKNNPTAEQNMGSTGTMGGGAAVAPQVGDDDAELQADMETRRRRDIYKSEDAASAPAPEKKSTIRTGSAIKDKDYNLADAGDFNKETGKAGKGIYTGESMRALDEDRKEASFQPGGLRDRFRKNSKSLNKFANGGG